MLDIGSVLLPSSMPVIIERLSAASDRAQRQIWRYFYDNLHDGFWGGQVSVEQFWRTMLDFTRLNDPVDLWQDTVWDILRPLPAVEAIPRWSGATRVAVLSNHRHEWIDPVFDALGIAPYFDRLLLSSRTGRVKPYPEAYEQLRALDAPPDRVLVVDDRPDALRRAEKEGVRTLQADERGLWIPRIDRILGVPTPAA